MNSAVLNFSEIHLPSLVLSARDLYSTSGEVDLYLIENQTKALPGVAEEKSATLLSEVRGLLSQAVLVLSRAAVELEPSLGSSVPSGSGFSPFSVVGLGVLDHFKRLLDSPGWEDFCRRSLSSGAASDASLSLLSELHVVSCRLSALFQHHGAAVLDLLPSLVEERDDVDFVVSMFSTFLSRSVRPWAGMFAAFATRCAQEAKARGSLLVFNYVSFESTCVTFAAADAQRAALEDSLRMEWDTISSPALRPFLCAWLVIATSLINGLI
jgi:hypothetical protein